MRGRLHLLLLAIVVPSASAEERRGAAGACATGSLQGPSGADAVTSINSPGGTPPPRDGVPTVKSTPDKAVAVVGPRSGQQAI